MTNYKKLFKEALTPNYLKEEDRATRVDKMMSGEYDDEDYKDSKRYDDIRGEVDEETKRYSTYEIRMVNQIRRAKKDGEPIYNLPMATQEYYRKNKAEMDALVAKEIDLLNKMYDKYKPKDEIDEGFKVGDKVTYLGHPAVVTATKEYNGRDFVSVSYDKGTGKTKASDILATDGTVKSLKEALNKRLGK